MKRYVSISLVSILVAGAAATGFWFGHDSKPAPPADHEEAAPEGESVASVETRAVVKGTIARTVDAYGTVQTAPGSVVGVSVPFDAIVNRVLAIPGARVEAGTPLADVGPTPEAQLQFRQAQDALAAADRNAEAVRKRLAEQLATNADVATAEQAQQAAKTQVESLSARGVQNVRQLTAPTAGIVGPITAQVGQVITAGSVVLTIAPPQGVEATVGVEPADAAGLRVGTVVELRDIAAAEDAPPTLGTVRLVTPAINPLSRLRDVVLTLPAETSLLPGMSVVGSIDVARATGLLVPRSAVRPDGDEQLVFVVIDGKARAHPVTLGMRNRTSVQVVCDEIHEGDAAVVSGAAELEDGMAVTAEPASAPTMETK